MNNRIFPASFIAAIVLNLIFFYVFQIKGPKVISIMESELYFIDDIIEDKGYVPDLQNGKTIPRVMPFFSFPVIYQKVFSPDMKYSINTLKDENIELEHDPFSEDNKIISSSMDFSSKFKGLSSRVSSRLDDAEDRYLKKVIELAERTMRVVLTRELSGYFDEEIIRNELINSDLIPGRELKIRVVFFTKNSFSIMMDANDMVGKDKLTSIFRKALRNKRYVPGKIAGVLRVEGNQ